MKKIIILVVLIAVAVGAWKFYEKKTPAPVVVEVPADIQAHIDSKSDLIRVELPAPMSVITSPLTIRGEARGYWFFEGDFPITLTNWDGLIIAEWYASFVHDPEDPESTWMTMEFVPFEGTLTFENPSFPDVESDHFSKRGYLIFHRNNPSDLPENDDALEIPVFFE